MSILGSFLFKTGAEKVAPKLVAAFKETLVDWWKVIGSKAGKGAAATEETAAHATAEAAGHAAGGAADDAAMKAAAKAAAEKAATVKKIKTGVGHTAAAAAVYEGYTDVPAQRNASGMQQAAEVGVGGLTGLTGAVTGAVATAWKAPGPAKLLFLPAAAAGAVLGYYGGKGGIIALEKLHDAADSSPSSAAAAGAPETGKTAARTITPDESANILSNRLAAETAFTAAMNDVRADGANVTPEHRAALTRTIVSLTQAEAAALGKPANAPEVAATVNELGSRIAQAGVSGGETPAATQTRADTTPTSPQRAGELQVGALT